jgi:peptidoglycan/xylan/chitin deacetylase (PgdA/CDA1 family)
MFVTDSRYEEVDRRRMALTDEVKLLVKSAVRKAANQTMHLAPVPLWRRLFPKTELGVCYHVVSDAPVPHVKHYHALNTAEFEADLSYLQRNFEFISYEQLVQRRSSANSVRDNSMVLTFDDGFAECASVVAPLLLRHGVSCIFFVITDLIDNNALFRESEAALCIHKILQLPFEQVETIIDELDLGPRISPPPAGALLDPTQLPLEVANLGLAPDARLRPLLYWLLNRATAEMDVLGRLQARLGVEPASYLRDVQPYLTTQQIRQLRSDGFTIGAHSCSHRRLQELSRADAEREIVESCRVIRDITGQSSVPFAFPYFGGDLDRDWLGALREQNDVIGLYFDTDGVREDEPFVVQRVFGERFGADRTMDAILRRAWARRPAWGRRG